MSKLVRWIVFTACCCSTCFLAEKEAYGQKKIDSLRLSLDMYRMEDTLKVRLLNQLGYEYWVVSPLQSEYYGLKALELADSLRFSSGSAFAKRVVGVSNWARGNFKQALSYLVESLEDYRMLGDKLGEANVTMNLGLVYADQANYQKALDLCFDAIQLFETLKARDRIGTTYTKIGSIYLNMNQLDLAYQYFTKALSIHQEGEFRYGIEEVTSLLGLLFLERNDPEKAVEYLQESLRIARSIGDQDNVAKNQAVIGHIYTRQGKLSDADNFLDNALRTASQNGLKKVLREVYAYKKELALAQNDFKKALEYTDQYIAVSDSLFNEEKAVEMANMMTALEVREKESELLIKQQEINILEQNARFYWWVRLSLTIGVIVLVVIGFMIISRQQLKIKSAREIAGKTEALLTSAKSLAEAKYENAQLREQELVRELEFKNKELTSYTINFIRKNELLEEITEEIRNIKKGADPALRKSLSQLHRSVESTLHVDRDWEDFKKYFESIYKDFFSKLKEIYPELTPTDLKMCALIRLNLSMKEMATILGISPESVKTSRYRLRKKLNLEHEENLLTFMFSIDKKAGASYGTLNSS